MPLVICCNLDLPDGSGMDFLDEVRAVQGDSFVVGMFQMKNPPVRFLLFFILTENNDLMVRMSAMTDEVRVLGSKA